MNDLINVLYELEDEFDPLKWEALTSETPGDSPVYMDVSIISHTFNTTTIDSEFYELVNLTLRHLETSEGQQKEYLSIVGSPTIDVSLSRDYLKSFLAV